MPNRKREGSDDCNSNREAHPCQQCEVSVRVFCLDDQDEPHFARILVTTDSRSLERQMRAMSSALEVWGAEMGHVVLSVQAEVQRAEEIERGSDIPPAARRSPTLVLVEPCGVHSGSSSHHSRSALAPGGKKLVRPHLALVPSV